MGNGTYSVPYKELLETNCVSGSWMAKLLLRFLVSKSMIQVYHTYKWVVIKQRVATWWT